MKKLLLAGAAFAALVSGAQAADLGVPRGPVAAVVVAPVFNWTGFYVGADVGFYSAQNSFAQPGNTFTASGSLSGVKLGGHLGYRYQFANNFVLGLEGDLSWLSAGTKAFTINGFAPNAYQARANWDGSIRATAGFAVDRALLYATGGVSFIGTTGCGVTAPGAACVLNTQFGGTRAGWTVGAGLAYAVTPNVALRGEYLYANYGTRTTLGAGFAGGSIAHRLDTHTVRLGVSYMFATGPSAVVARY